MKSVIKAAEGLVREIEIEVPADVVDAAYSELYEKYRKEARIKGFRPGKVPMNVIKSKFKDAVHDEVLQDLVSKTYRQAVQEQALQVASPPDFPEMNLKEGEPLKYTARVEVMPDIDKIDYEGLELPKEEIEVRDVEVDTVVEHLRNKKAEIRPVDRPAGAGDILVIDLKAQEDSDNVLEGKEFKDIELDLSSGMTVGEFKEALVGIKAGEEKDVTVDYPEDFSNKNLAGKKLVYHCVIKQVKEKILPQANDAFAKAQGGVETMLEMRLKIREDLNKQKELDHRSWEKQELMRQINLKNQIPIPEAMIDHYLDSIIEDMKQKEQEFDEVLIRQQYRPNAIEYLRWNLIMNRLAELEKIEVLPSDTENWIKGFAAGYQMEIDQAKKLLARTGRIEEIRDTIKEDKVCDFLLSKASHVVMDNKVTIGGEPEHDETKDTDAKGSPITEEK
nr:trigger factor [candidate division Zixibacteria bacterium]